MVQSRVQTEIFYTEESMYSEIGLAWALPSGLSDELGPEYEAQYHKCTRLGRELSDCLDWSKLATSSVQEIISYLSKSGPGLNHLQNMYVPSAKLGRSRPPGLRDEKIRVSPQPMGLETLHKSISPGSQEGLVGCVAHSYE